MVEILWKSNAPHSPRRDHEIVELRLLDVSSTDTPRYLVREIHACWSAAAQQIQWNGYKDEAYGTPQEAVREYASRKESIAKAGFPYATILN
jgi:hypothetical protein